MDNMAEDPSEAILHFKETLFQVLLLVFHGPTLSFIFISSLCLLFVCLFVCFQITGRLIEILHRSPSFSINCLPLCRYM